MSLAPKIIVAALALLTAGTLPGRADQLESIGSDVAFAMPLVAGGIAVYKGDWTGVVQLGADGFSTVATVYALKHVVRERRPDKSDYQSFPSDTVAVSASASSFLWARYGWQYGLPAFAASEFVAYTRVESKKHHWYDTLASSAIAAGYAYALDTRYREPNRFHSDLSVTPDSAYIRLAFQF